MKSIHLTCAALTCAALMSCGSLQTDTAQVQKKETSTFGKILSAMTNGDALGNAFNSVIGLDKPTEAQLYGSWHYTQPGVAFTSKNALAKAGGEVAATQAKEKLKAPYQSVGFNARNTTLQLNKDKTFTIQLAGKTFQGSYTYHPDECKLDLQTFLITFPCYVKRTPKGMSFLLESKKLLTLFQAIASISGNSKLETIGKISKNYDGIRMGFEMGK